MIPNHTHMTQDLHCETCFIGTKIILTCVEISLLIIFSIFYLDEVNNGTKYRYIFLIVGLEIISAREISNLFTDGIKNYFFKSLTFINFENWMQLAMIIFVYLILMLPNCSSKEEKLLNISNCNNSRSTEDGSEQDFEWYKLKRILAANVIVISWVDWIIQVCKHPSFKRYTSMTSSIKVLIVLYPTWNNIISLYHLKIISDVISKFCGQSGL